MCSPVLPNSDERPPVPDTFCHKQETLIGRPRTRPWCWDLATRTVVCMRSKQNNEAQRKERREGLSVAQSLSHTQSLSCDFLLGRVVCLCVYRSQESSSVPRQLYLQGKKMPLVPSSP